MALSDRPFGPVSGAATVPTLTPINQQAAQAGPLPVTQQIVTTAETQIVSAELATLPLFISIPPDKMLEQTVFDLFVSGYIKQPNATASTITLKLYEGDSATIGSNTLLGSSGAITQTNTTESFWGHAHLIYNSVSQTLSGTIDWYVNRTAVAVTTLSNFPANINNNNDPVATFTLTCTSSGAASATPTTINVQKFTVG